MPAFSLELKAKSIEGEAKKHLLDAG